MKKIFKLLFVMFMLYFVLQVCFRIFGTGYELKYDLKLDDNIIAEVQEVYTGRVKNEKTNYYFDIKINDQTFSLQTYKSFMFNSKIIKDIKYYKGMYTCIYPIFSGKKQLTDVLCLDNGVLKNYNVLKGKDSQLDTFVNKLVEEKLYIDNFVDNTDDDYTIDKIKIYPNNIVSKHSLAINNYNGIYTINNRNSKKSYNVELFEDDVYTRNLSALASKYYITPDYSSEYDFNVLYRVDITNNKISSFHCNTPISYNSYIQGVVNDKIYLVDKNNKKQYEINPKKKTVTEIGNESTLANFYESGNWSEVSIYDLVNTEKYFIYNSSDITNTNYAKIDKVGNKLSGYYYYYLKNGNGYDVYRANVQNTNQLKYIFTTTDMNNIEYIDDNVYYYVNNNLKVYHDSIGNRTIYEYKEYEFNKSLKYFVTK